MIITASLIVMACQKEVAAPLDANAPFDAKAAKEWYYGTYKKTAEWAGYDAVTNGKRLPDWEKGIQRKIGKMEIVEFPFVKEKNSFKMIYRGELSAESKRKMAEAALSRLLFTKYPSGAIQVREMQYIPDMDYLARHNFDASSNSFGDIDNDFSGTIVAKTWNGQEVSRKILKNGKITASFKRALSQPASPTESCPIGTIQVDEYARDCESHLYGDGLFTYQCDPWFATGNQWCIGEEEINEDPECTVPNSPECSCSLTGGCEDPEGGGPPSCEQQASNVFSSATSLSQKESVEELSNNGITRNKRYIWKVYTVSNGMIPMFLKSRDNSVQTKGMDGNWRFTSLSHENVVKSGTEILYSVSVENENATTTIEPHLGVSDQVGRINLAFTVKISIICDGLPVVHNDPTNSENSWHVSE